MILKDMKLPKKKDSSKIVEAKTDRDQYPWGLRMDLGTEVIEKLDGADELNAGDKVLILAHGTVISKRVHQKQGGKDHSLEIQIEKLGVSELKPEDKMSMKEFAESRNRAGK